MKKLGKTQRKILLLLLGGVALGLSGSPKRYFRILKEIQKEWNEIDNRDLKRGVGSLHRSKLITEKYNKDGTVTLHLSKDGREQALRFNLDEMTIPRPRRWNRIWHIVIYDIPEKKKMVRESVRMHLKQLGFHELQHSVFIHPFECAKQVEFITTFYRAQKYIRIIQATSINHDRFLRERFDLA